VALLLASTFPHLGHGAIGLVPSASAYPAPAASLRAWMAHGKAVPLEQIPVQRISSPVLTEAVVFRRHQNAGFAERGLLVRRRGRARRRPRSRAR
jgi:hypothetical protein